MLGAGLDDRTKLGERVKLRSLTVESETTVRPRRGRGWKRTGLLSLGTSKPAVYVGLLMGVNFLTCCDGGTAGGNRDEKVLGDKLDGIDGMLVLELLGDSESPL